MARVLIKSGVQPRLLVLLAAVANSARDLPWDVTITAGNDGCHKQGSKHYTFEAIDVRSKNFPTLDAKEEFLESVLGRLGAGYQMFLEAAGTDNEHFHLEYDPR